jgi:hypothetical protein
MSVRVCNNRSPSPLGISGRCHDRGWIIAQSGERSINGGNSKANASAKSGRSIGGERVKLEHASWKLGREMLRATTVPMLGELQTKPRVESGSTCNIR